MALALIVVLIVAMVGMAEAYERDLPRQQEFDVAVEQALAVASDDFAQWEQEAAR